MKNVPKWKDLILSDATTTFKLESSSTTMSTVQHSISYYKH